MAKLIFDQAESGYPLALRGPYRGSQVEIVHVGAGVVNRDVGALYAVKVVGGDPYDHFGAYGDELFIVPEPREGARFVCPDCGCEELRVLYQRENSQRVSVRTGPSGEPIVEDYFGDDNEFEAGEDEWVYCTSCDWQYALGSDAQALDKIAEMFRERMDVRDPQVALNFILRLGEVVESSGRKLD